MSDEHAIAHAPETLAAEELPAYVAPFIQETGMWKNRLIVDGRVVPHITAFVLDTPGGHRAMDGHLATREFNLFLDDRFCIIIREHELQTWGWFLANAMAVAAGWSSFGDERSSIRLNPYGQHAPVVAEYDFISDATKE